MYILKLFFCVVSSFQLVHRELTMTQRGLIVQVYNLFTFCYAMIYSEMIQNRYFVSQSVTVLAITHSLTHSINQSINQSINRSVSQSCNQPMDQPICTQYIDQSYYRLIEDWISQLKNGYKTKKINSQVKGSINELIRSWKFIRFVHVTWTLRITKWRVRIKAFFFDFAVF